MRLPLDGGEGGAPHGDGGGGLGAGGPAHTGAAGGAEGTVAVATLEEGDSIVPSNASTR